MVRLGMMVNEGDMDARLWSIVMLNQCLGEKGGHATRVMKGWPEPRQTSSKKLNKRRENH